ncbi:MAG TPA: LuxR C-terminal-related transcriptional regulator [Nocardioidaceae bacterium]|nr:LuxR C-terminal-related transcriptional regulator [Nocardioidaceae bacterium]
MDTWAQPTRDVLVGREGALKRLDSALARSAGALVVGEAGVGKSHLARRFAERAEASGAPLDRVAAMSGLRERPLAALRPVLGAGPPAHDDPVSWATDQLCRNLPAGLLVVDDVDVLDEVSALALHRVADLPARRTPPRLLATLRSGRVPPEPVERLLTQGLLEQIPLSPLPQEAVAELASEILGGPVDTSAALQLATQSRGNPLFVRELVLAGCDGGAWERRASGWCLRGPIAVVDRLRPLVDARVAGLTGTARRLAETIALAGPLPPAVVLELNLIDGVAALQATGTSRVDSTGIGLRHPMFAESLLAAASPRDTDRILERLLDVSAQAELPLHTIVRVTALAIERDHHVDGTRLVAAAQMAMALYDLPLARDLATAALRTGDMRGARLIDAQAGAMLGDPTATAALAAMALDEGSPDRDPAGLALARLQVTGPDGADRALRALPQRETAMVETVRAVALMRAGSWAEATRAAHRALEQAEEPDRWLEAAAVSVLLLVYGEDTVAGLDIGRRALALLDEGTVTGPHAPLALAHATAIGALLDGQPALAEQIAGSDAPGGADTPVFTAHRCMRLGIVHLFRGRTRSAARQLEATLPLLADFDPVDIRSWTHSHLAQAQAMRGDATAAADSARRAREVLVDGQATTAYILTRAEAWVLAARDRAAEATAVIRELADRWTAAPAIRALVGVDVARYGDLGVAASLLDGAGAATRSRTLTAAEQTVRAVLGNRTGDVLAGAQRLQGCGMDLWAADLLARAAQRDGIEDAAVLRGAALAASLPCEGARTPALKRLSHRLTATQSRVAELAAQGLSNRQIGETLGMSPRTAATHLHRAYKVLGVNERSQLTVRLGQI